MHRKQRPRQSRAIGIGPLICERLRALRERCQASDCVNTILGGRERNEGRFSCASRSTGDGVVCPSCDHALPANAGLAFDTRTKVPPGRVELHRRATNEAKRAPKLANSPGKDHSGGCCVEGPRVNIPVLVEHNVATYALPQQVVNLRHQPLVVVDMAHLFQLDNIVLLLRNNVFQFRRIVLPILVEPQTSPGRTIRTPRCGSLRRLGSSTNSPSSCMWGAISASTPN